MSGKSHLHLRLTFSCDHRQVEERVMLPVRTKIPAIFYLYVLAILAMAALVLSRLDHI
jgi:hypothetical protein